MPNTKKTFSNLIKTEFNFLHTLGFDPCKIKEKHTVASGYHIVGTYKNRANNRTIKITYSPKNEIHREAAYTSIDREPTEPLDDFDYTTTNYIRVDSIIISELDGDIESRLLTYFRATANILITNFSSIIKGEDWENIPFDWGDWK